MPITLYDASVPVFTRLLGGLDAILAKAEAHAQARKFDPDTLMQVRLFPDMYPLAMQVRIACDAAKFGVARLAGIEAPKFEDSERTLAELRERIARTLAFIAGVPRSSIDGQEDRDVVIPMRERKLEMKGIDFLLHRALPNFYFHLTTAYNLLRHNGVEIGKQDYLGRTG